MDDQQDRIDSLLRKLEILTERHDGLNKELQNLKDELTHLKRTEQIHLKQIQKQETPPQTEPSGEDSGHIITPTTEEVSTADLHPPPLPKTAKNLRDTKIRFWQNVHLKDNLEKFIGENLISKIGIIIIVLGAGIGVKYAIDHDLISPLIRIVLGYALGGVLLGIALRLKKRYSNFSAVLLSGAMAIFYFITYAAFSYYALIPQGVAFGVMFLITAFTVLAALQYSREVIAHIGLVGAYGVPFLLGGDPEKVTFLFSYVLLINIGVLFLSFRRNWKPLLYAALGLTWLILLSWHYEYYDSASHLALTLVFSSCYFLVFYLTVLAYKLLHLQKFEMVDILLLLINSFLFYAIGYASLNAHDTGQDFLGLFTLANAVVHIAFSFLVYSRRLTKPDLFYFITALALVFVTIAIPVQLEGPWVTILWAGEAAALFWVGRTRARPVYEKLSYALVILAFMSQVYDWWPHYDGYFVDLSEGRIMPVFHVKFLTTALLVGAYVFIYNLNKQDKFMQSANMKPRFANTLNLFLPGAIIGVVYYALYLEISLYWDQLFYHSTDLNTLAFHDTDLYSFRKLWLINYSLLFLSLLLIVNEKRWRSNLVSIIGVCLLVYAVGTFLIAGLPELVGLEESVTGSPRDELYAQGVLHYVMRYVSLVFGGFALWAGSWVFVRNSQLTPIRIPFALLLHIAILWILSSELIHWLEAAGAPESDKLGLSILWGVYSFALIALGIWKKRAYLRIAAIVLFGITLVKLFFYDISHLDTISKTILFIALGALLLSISFLYTKYREVLFGD